MVTTRELLGREWRALRRPARLIALALATLAVIGIGVLTALSSSASCPGHCPAIPVAADGSVVADRFAFRHRGLGPTGSITVRLTSMTGTITYPPPDHDRIVPGLVPWAKVGIIVKDGLRQGSPYAALVMTGRHGVRMQYDYRYDIDGEPGRGSDVSAASPRWLRLTRSGDTVSGFQSWDGRHWSRVGTARLPGLPATAQVGLLATSPGDLSLDRVALGGSVETVRFTQAVGTFDHLVVRDGRGPWRSDTVGELNQTDWEKGRHRSGTVVAGRTIQVSGTGDIGPLGEDGMPGFTMLLAGWFLALAIVVAVASRFGTASVGAGARSGDERRRLVTRAVVVAGAGFVIGLVAVGVTLPVGAALLARNGVTLAPVSTFTYVRVVAGLAVSCALVAVLAYGLGLLLRRAWLAIAVGLAGIVLPYAAGSLPLLPDDLARWLFRVTPAAGFAVQQTVEAYPQVVAHLAPSAGYFPLPWWAGLGVLGAYAGAVTAASVLRRTGRVSSARKRGT